MDHDCLHYWVAGLCHPKFLASGDVLTAGFASIPSLSCTCKNYEVMDGELWVEEYIQELS